LSASFTRQTVAVTSLNLSMLRTSGARSPGRSMVLSDMRPMRMILSERRSWSSSSSVGVTVIVVVAVIVTVIVV
jgi:hypothetical protein